MQIQRGIVKYKDRSDYDCRYGVTDDGKQYYLFDNGTLANGNLIATTALIEVIDHSVVASSIGVIDSQGNVVIPFEHKSIKPIHDQLLLVESNHPVTESVLEAVKLRSDPLAATKLVSTSATIKDKISAKMGADGKFIFNDQFSEASIYDIFGKNLIDNQTYSFIGMNDTTLFFSKNTVDSEIVEYPLPVKSEEEVQSLPDSSEVVDSSDSQEQLDVSSVPVDKEDIDQALGEEREHVDLDNQSESTSATTDFNDSLNSQDDSLDSTNSVSEPLEVSNLVPQEESQPQQEESAPLPDSRLDVDEKPSDITFQFENEDNPLNLPDTQDQSFDEKELVEGDDSNSDLFISKSSHSTDQDALNKRDLGYSSFDDSMVDDHAVFGDSILKEDKIMADDYHYSDSYSYREEKDTIIEDVAATMSDLMRLYREQRKTIAVYEDRIQSLTISAKNSMEQAKRQTREIGTLQDKLSDCESKLATLDSRNQMLMTKLRNQEAVIDSQKEELEILRPQIEGKKDLVRLLHDAQNLLGPDSYTDTSDSYHKKMIV